MVPLIIPIHTREAVLADMEILSRFQQGVVSTERPFDPTIKKEPVTYYDIESMILSPDTALIVAEAGDQIVGCGYAQIRTAKPYCSPEKYGYMGFMYVNPGYRGVGVNKTVMDALKSWCASRGLAELRLSVYAENSSAVQAYRKVGFTPLLVEMRMNLHEQ